MNDWDWRWLFLFGLPLFSGVVSGIFVLLSNRGGVNADFLKKEGVEASTDAAGKLTYLGAVVTGLATLNKDSYLTKATENGGAGLDGHDLAVLFAANIVFAVIAASHLLLSGFNDLLARGAVVAGVMASLVSVIALIWRAPDENFPALVRWGLLLMLGTAAVLIFVYIRGRAGRFLKKFGLSDWTDEGSGGQPLQVPRAVRSPFQLKKD